MISKDFDHTVDKFSDIEWYKNKDNPKPGTTGLSLAVTNDGTVFLISQYHGDDWIFHKQVQVRIGDKVYTSEVGQVDTQVGNYGVYESVVYTQGEDSGIAEAIARSGDQDVFVRLSGKYDKDFTLSKKDKLAILESYTLAVLLDKRNDNEQ
ncbi:MAG: hypothetical protein K2Q22_12615 [Cytophagales bacterium]|nr:hypothetical protein [Cytophagales bacterium]